MATQIKIDKISRLKEEIKDKTNFIFADYKGLTVAQISKLRKKLKEVGAKFKVLKNSLAKRAFNELGIKVDENIFQGTVSVASFGNDIDILKPIKVFDEYIRYDEKKILKLKYILLGNEVISEENFKAMAKLPSREILISKFTSILKSPITNLCIVLSGIYSKLILVLKEIEKKKSSGG